MSSKLKAVSSKSSNKSKKAVEKGKKKLFCKYYKATDHIIKDCPKVKAKEAKKREADMTIIEATTTPSNGESTNIVQDANWAFSMTCSHNPSLHGACMSNVDSHVWCFDSGALKHITSQHDMFTSLETVPTRNSVTCADNSSYPVKGVGQIVLAAANDNAFTLRDVLYVPGIKKNLLSVFALTRVGLVVEFVDDRCIVHDLSDGDTIVASDSLC